MVENIIKQIQNLIDGIHQIKDDDYGFDDIKELEFYDAEIINLIFNFCLEKRYNFRNFPSQYLDLLILEDEDFMDFLSFDVKYYFVLNLSLIKEDVLSLVKIYYSNNEVKAYEDDECKEDITVNIQLLEDEKISLNYNKEDFASIKSSKPKLP
jgi:hypothetical protein